MRLLPYIARRLLFAIPQLLGIIVVSFALIKAISGDPAVLMLGPLASQASVDALRAELGLNQPLVVQFWIYLDGLLHGDLGTSWQTTRPVFEDLLLRFPATLELITLGLLGALAIGTSTSVSARPTVTPVFWGRSATFTASPLAPCPTSGWRWC